MLAFKIYFNGKEFVADNVATEVQSVSCDSTVQWFRKQKFADDAVEKLNANHLKMLKHVNSVEYFYQTEDERQWFIDRK